MLLVLIEIASRGFRMLLVEEGRDGDVDAE